MKSFNISIFIVLIFSLGINAELEEKTDIDDRAGSRFIENALKDALDSFDPFYLPFLPLISYKMDDRVDFSFVFTDINITGLTNLDVTDTKPRKSFTTTLVFHNLMMEVGDYSAGGHINNMPFGGESFMVSSLQDLTFKFSADFSTFDIDLSTPEDSEFCIIANTTEFFMDIIKPVVYFDNLNSGTDQGLLFNTILSAAIPDIIDQLSSALNNGLHDAIDGLLVGIINNKACNEPPTSDVSGSFDNKSLQYKFLEEVKAYIGTLKR